MLSSLCAFVFQGGLDQFCSCTLCRIPLSANPWSICLLVFILCPDWKSFLFPSRAHRVLPSHQETFPFPDQHFPRFSLSSEVFDIGPVQIGLDQIVPPLCRPFGVTGWFQLPGTTLLTALSFGFLMTFTILLQILFRFWLGGMVSVAVF